MGNRLSSFIPEVDEDEYEFETLFEGGGATGARARKPGRPEAPSSRPAHAPASCTQLMFLGDDSAGNFCNVHSGDWVPAFLVTGDAISGTKCNQFCLPAENSLPLLKVLKADIGLCCLAGPGYNDFQGSINQRIPGVAPVRTWLYDEGGPAF